MKQVTEKCKYKVIPGWNRNVKQHYKIYRMNYLKWLENGKSRESREFNVMKDSRKIFKGALNDCKLNEAREISLSIQEKYDGRDMNSFWKDVKLKNNKVKYSEVIDGKKQTP